MIRIETLRRIIKQKTNTLINLPKSWLEALNWNDECELKLHLLENGILITKEKE